MTFSCAKAPNPPANRPQITHKKSRRRPDWGKFTGINYSSTAVPQATKPYLPQG
jgi:hypothetical protein